MKARIISRRHPRIGRGFSKSELKESGLTKQDARALKIHFDPLRKSSYKENVAALKKVEKPAKKPKKTAKKPAENPAEKKAESSKVPEKNE